VEDRFKLVLTPGDDTTEQVELFDLDSDPAETRNVASDHPAVVAELAAGLEEWEAQYPSDGLRRSTRPRHWRAPPDWAHLPEFLERLDAWRAAPPERRQVESAPPAVPSVGAIELATRSDLTAFERAAGKPTGWKVRRGVIDPRPDSVLRTRERLRDVDVGVEWRLRERGARRRERASLWLLDDHEIRLFTEGAPDDRPDLLPGGVPRQSPPAVDAYVADGEWESIRVEFRAPPEPLHQSVRRGGPEGRRHPTIRVVRNGLVVQDHTEIRPADERAGNTPRSAAPVRLQVVGDPVEFRRLWVRPVRPAGRELPDS
jgi:hypothetical protein